MKRTTPAELRSKVALHTRAAAVVIAIVGTLVACSGSSKSGNIPSLNVPISPPATTTAPPSSSPGGTPAPSPTALIYVSNTSQGTSAAIEAFALNVGGNIAPIKTISGSQTQLIAPYAIAFDSLGNLYVTNWPTPHEQLGSFITVYPPNSSGNVAPSRMIQGSNTGFGQNTLSAIAMDRAGSVYVAVDTSHETCTGSTSSTCTADSNDTIAVFAPGSTGNIFPSRTINSSSCFAIGGMTVLPSNELAVACMPPSNPAVPYSVNRGGTYADFRARYMDYSENNAEIAIFAPNASGNAAPTRVIAGANTGLSWAGPLVASPLGSLLVVPESPPENNPRIVGFPQMASGDIPPTTDVAGPSTQLNAISIAADANGVIYALNSINGTGNLTITEYANNANGNSTPMFAISGAHTNLNCSQDLTFCLGGIAVGPP